MANYDGSLKFDTAIDSKGFESGANKITSLASKGATAIAAGLAAAGAAFTALATQSIKAYADYEQLIGGVETLFGDSSGVVEKYAESAYKTANMSANQYMETITSFSASLLQGLGGDTEKAAEIGNMAVTDMADNANKMGTAIDSIQNAYQGFAKDNFTMLDNLKLGYGGTAAEMARLVNDSGVLGESFKATAKNVKDIPFDKMVEAIHIVQTEMGITGTTAIESSETISGSWNTLKSSWTNVLTSLASDNDVFFNNSIKALASSADVFLDNVMGALSNVVSGFGQLASELISKVPDMLQRLLPDILTGAKTLLESLLAALPALMTVLADVLPMAVEAILSMLPLLMQTGIDIVVQLIEGIAQALPELIPTAIEAVMTLVGGILDNIPLLVDVAIALVDGLIDGIITSLPLLIESATSLVIGFIDGLAFAMPLIAEKGPEIIETLVTAITEAIPMLSDAVIEIILALVDFIANNTPLMLEAGFQITVSLGEGILEAIPELLAIVPELIGALTGGIRDSDWSESAGAFSGLFDTISEYFNTRWPEMLGQFFANMVGTVRDGFQSVWGGIGELILPALQDAIGNANAFLSESIPAMIDNIGKWFDELPGKLGTALGKALGTITKWVSDAVSHLSEAIPKLINDIGNWFSELPGKIEQWLTSSLNAVKRWFTDLITTAQTEVPRFINGIVTLFESLPDKILEVGKNIVEGLWNGIQSASSWLMSQIDSFIDGIKSGFKNAFDINSPSGWMRREIGRQIPPGVALGVDDEMGYIDNSINAMMDRVHAAAESNQMRVASASGATTIYNTTNNATEGNTQPSIALQIEINANGSMDVDQAEEVGRVIADSAAREMRWLGVLSV